jgi:hypothetical protein
MEEGDMSGFGGKFGTTPLENGVSAQSISGNGVVGSSEKGDGVVGRSAGASMTGVRGVYNDPAIVKKSRSMIPSPTGRWLKLRDPARACSGFILALKGRKDTAFQARATGATECTE